MVYLRCFQPFSKKSVAVAMLSIAVASSGLAPEARATEMTNPPGAIAQAQDGYQEIAEQFVDAMAREDLEGARELLHPALQKEISAVSLLEDWQEILAMTGEFQERLGSSTIENTGNDENLVLVSIQFDQVTEDLLVMVNDDREIVNFDFPQGE